MKFDLKTIALVKLFILLLLSFQAAAANVSFCDKLASGDAARVFQNPIDESLGQAWPLQGEVLSEFLPFTFADKEYLAFRKLGQGAEGIAYLGFDSSFFF